MWLEWRCLEASGRDGSGYDDSLKRSKAILKLLSVLQPWEPYTGSTAEERGVEMLVKAAQEDWGSVRGSNPAVY